MYSFEEEIRICGMITATGGEMENATKSCEGDRKSGARASRKCKSVVKHTQVSFNAEKTERNRKGAEIKMRNVQAEDHVRAKTSLFFYSIYSPESGERSRDVQVS